AGAQAEPIKVSASFSILGDMVKQVGGDRVEVFTFVGPNGDAHVYEPTPANAKELSESKILFINGLGLEGRMKRLEKSYRRSLSYASLSSRVLCTFQMSRHPAVGPPSQPKIESAKRPSAGADRPQTDSAAGGTSMLNRTGSREAKGRISQGVVMCRPS